tara:strand:+ start:1264 stop:1437 length:174 start_codon:yes stop_codon:yes gene_type:complete
MLNLKIALLVLSKHSSALNALKDKKTVKNITENISLKYLITCILAIYIILPYNPYKI